MPTDDVDTVLEEATLLVQYAAKKGKLPPNSRIFELISLHTRAQENNEKLDLAPLYLEIDQVSKAIYPETLKQLLQRQTAVGQFRNGLAKVTPIMIGTLTLLLTLYLAFQSSELQKADLALREYQDWWAEQPREKLYNAWKMFRYERVLNIQTPPLAQLDQYQRLVGDAKRLVEKGGAIQTLLQQSATMRYLPPIFELHGPVFLTDFAKTMNGTAPPDFEKLPNYGEGEKVADCSDQTGKPTLASKAIPIVSTKDVVAYLGSIDCFLKSLKISAAQADYAPWLTIYETKAKVSLLVVWLLPGLYGLLGACVYIMRDFVFASRANQLMRDTAFLGTLSFLLRIALGGLAGIIIGWFWIPGSTNANTTTVPISSIPFGLAFLAGFSIENLFSLLDRLNKTIGQHDVGGHRK